LALVLSCANSPPIWN